MASVESNSIKEQEEFGLFAADPAPAARAILDPAQNDSPARSAPASGSGAARAAAPAHEELFRPGSPARPTTISAGGAQGTPEAAQHAPDMLLSRCVQIRLSG